jgi:hypothetical protein
MEHPTTSTDGSLLDEGGCEMLQRMLALRVVILFGLFSSARTVINASCSG